ncbi:hypothetical protein LTR53_011794 [Teratosphaeriaceae sp. CCFEE 6253]|nr:hypothetical protein LTR53_011794 [Teratosphaeriaceae sp. CCFEE 6253]
MLDAYAANDWDCKCTWMSAVLTCYANCPTDLRTPGVQQQQTSTCNTAKTYPTTSSSLFSAALTTSTLSPHSTASASVTLAGVTENAGLASTTSSGAAGASVATASSFGSAAAPTSKSAGAAQIAPAGLAAVLGLMAFL